MKEKKANSNRVKTYRTSVERAFASKYQRQKGPVKNLLEFFLKKDAIQC
jgi:hypothetical protein